MAPTGAGKTEMGAQAVRRALDRVRQVVWLTHTQDLVRQTAARLSRAGFRVGVVMAGEAVSPFASVQVASVQTLIARRDVGSLRCDVLVIDEAHHWAADEFKAAADALGAQRVLGLTATPERGDGRPLGDVFEELVVACHYSELVGSGVLTPVRILRPSQELESAVAQDPVEAYLAKGEKRSGFVFCRNIEEARALAARFTAAGVPSECVDAETEKEQRAASLARLVSGQTKLLTNVYALTEGVDVPSASICILARGIGHVSTYLQICGRGLRAHEGKEDFLLLDLPGVSHRFGAPIEDRDYSLSGEGIKRKAEAALRVCLHCGYTYESGDACPRCHQKNPQTAAEKKAIRNARKELVETRHAETPSWQKKAEFMRLQATARNMGHKPGWVIQTFVRMFGHPPEWKLEVPREERKKQWERLQATHPPGRAGWIYRQMFGQHPPAEWRKKKAEVSEGDIYADDNGHDEYGKP